MPELYKLFPIPIMKFSTSGTLHVPLEILESIELRVLSDDANRRHGRRSENSYILNIPQLHPLRAFCLRAVNAFASEALGLEGSKFGISQSWISHKEPGEELARHDHPNSIISGVFYWRKNPEPLQFFAPQWPLMMRQGSVHEIEPMPGAIYIFPSFLSHSVPKNTSIYAHRSLAFNAVPVVIGEEESLTELRCSEIFWDADDA